MKNIKFLSIIFLFHLLCFSNNGIGRENIHSKATSFHAQNYKPLHLTSLQNIRGSVEFPRTKRKYGLNETNYSLIVSENNIAQVYFTSSIFNTEGKKHLSEYSFSFYLLRGPPVV